MCDPTLALLQGGMSILGNMQEHNAQKAAYESNRLMSLNAQKDEQRQINIQRDQEGVKAAQTILDNNLEADQLKARATVAGGESGALLNNNAILQDIDRQVAVANTGVTQNLENTNISLNEQMLGAKSRAQSRINSVSRPSKTATALKIGSNLVSTGQSWKDAGGTFDNPFGT